MKIPKSRLILLAVFAASLVFFIFQMDLLPGVTSRLEQSNGFELLARLLGDIRDNYLEERDPLRTADGAYRGLINSLDVLSSYLDKTLTVRYLSQTENMAEPGVIIYKTYGDFSPVLGVIEGSPADKAGLLSGDVISAIDGRNTLNMSLVEANLYLKGMEGTSVEFKVLRGEDTYEMKVGRAVLFPQPYSLTHEKSGLTILTIHRLTPSAVSGIRKEILPDLKKDRTPLVIDLRHCNEGDFGGAQAFVNLFVRARSVGYFGKKGGITKPVSGPATPFAPDLDLVVWIGPATMGAAEFVAGILQEVKKVKVIGLPTLGLVAKREHFRLKDGSSVLLTSEVFSLPSGRSLWERGIRPDENIQAGLFDNKAYIEKTLPFPPKR